MQKRYELILSDKNEMEEFPSSTGTEKKSIREMELNFLEWAFKIAANNQTDICKVNACLDSVGRTDNLSDDENLIIDDEDLDFIKDAFKNSVGRRPYECNVCTKLIAQLAKPVEQKEEEPTE